MTTDTNTANRIFRELPIRYIHPDRACEWLPDAPPALTAQLSANERLWRRLSLIIAIHYKFEDYKLEDHPAIGSGVDHAIAVLDYATLMRMVRIAGAIWHGRALAKLIDKAALSQVLTLIDESAYRLAVVNADLAPSDAEDLPTKQSLLLNGRHCFLCWLNELPEFLLKRVILKFPKEFLSGPFPASHDGSAVAIFRKSAEGLAR